MITLEMDDGYIQRFNLPSEKEKKLLDMWTEIKNKKICLTTAEGEKIDIKFSEVLDCYIGEKEKSKQPYYSQQDKKQMTDFLGMLGL